MHSKVYQWVETFQSGRTSVNEDLLDCLASSLMADNVEWVNSLVQEERWITVTCIANKSGISCGSAYSIIHKDNGYHLCMMGAKDAYRW